MISKIFKRNEQKRDYEYVSKTGNLIEAREIYIDKRLFTFYESEVPKIMECNSQKIVYNTHFHKTPIFVMPPDEN